MNDQDGEIRVIDGKAIADDRGEVVFVNGFDFEGIRRFYCVSNHRVGFVRAWQAHRREAKYVTAISGAALVGAVRIDDWRRPSPELEVARHVLSASSPRIIYIPPGHANGFMSLTGDARLLFFSTVTVEESREDDIRYDARYWDIWKVKER